MSVEFYGSFVAVPKLDLGQSTGTDKESEASKHRTELEDITEFRPECSDEPVVISTGGSSWRGTLASKM